MPSGSPCRRRRTPRLRRGVLLLALEGTSLRAQSRDVEKVVRATRLSNRYRSLRRATLSPFFELDLFLVDSDTIRFDGELLLVVFSVGLIPVVDSGSGSADAEPLAEIATFRQRGRCGMSSARQLADQAGVRVRSSSKNGRSGEFVTVTWSSSSMVYSLRRTLSNSVPI